MHHRPSEVCRVRAHRYLPEIVMNRHGWKCGPGIEVIPQHHGESSGHGSWGRDIQSAGLNWAS